MNSYSTAVTSLLATMGIRLFLELYYLAFLCDVKALMGVIVPIGLITEVE